MLIVCSSLDGRTVTCQALSLLLGHTPNHRTCPNSIFCLRSHLLRHTTHLSSGLKKNSLATLPVVRARTKSMSTCVPAGMVSVASKRVCLRARVFGTNFHPTVGTKLSISHMKKTTRVGTVGGVTTPVHARLTRCQRLTTFTRFNSRLSTSADRGLTRKRQLGRVLGRPRCRPVPITGRVIVVCTTIGGCLVSVPMRRVLRFRSTLLRLVSAECPRVAKGVARARIVSRRARRGLVTTVRRAGGRCLTWECSGEK